MDEKKNIYTLILTDGTRIENLEMNGNNFVSTEPINKEIFEGNLSPVIISDGIHMDSHPYMELVQILEYPEDLWYFVLRDVPDSELALHKMNSNIQYISMMTGVELF